MKIKMIQKKIGIIIIILIQFMMIMKRKVQEQIKWEYKYNKLKYNFTNNISDIYTEENLKLWKKFSKDKVTKKKFPILKNGKDDNKGI